MRARPTLFAVVALSLALALPPGAADPVPASTHVHMQSIKYDPVDVTIAVGESVDWDNHDVVTHTVTADDGSFDSGDLGSGATYARAFPTVGTFPYHCTYHSGMKGKVIVSDPNALPDLAVAGVTSVDLFPGVTKQVNVTVRNLGLAGAAASVARVAYLHGGQQHLIADVDVPLLGPGDSFVAKATWNVLGKVGDFTIAATADATGAVAEGDEGNNEGSGSTFVLVGGIPGMDLMPKL